MSKQFNSKISQKKTHKLLWTAILDEEQEIVIGELPSTGKPPGEDNGNDNAVTN